MKCDQTIEDDLNLREKARVELKDPAKIRAWEIQEYGCVVSTDLMTAGERKKMEANMFRSGQDPRLIFAKEPDRKELDELEKLFSGLSAAPKAESKGDAKAMEISDEDESSPVESDNDSDGPDTDDDVSSPEEREAKRTRAMLHRRVKRPTAPEGMMWLEGKLVKHDPDIVLKEDGSVDIQATIKQQKKNQIKRDKEYAKQIKKADKEREKAIKQKEKDKIKSDKLHDREMKKITKELEKTTKEKKKAVKSCKCGTGIEGYACKTCICNRGDARACSAKCGCFANGKFCTLNKSSTAPVDA
jgi:hypothetical protein